jgi:hypothetical protein
MTDTIRTRDERRQERSYQQLELSHLSYVIQWRYDDRLLRVACTEVSCAPVRP